MAAWRRCSGRGSLRGHLCPQPGQICGWHLRPRPRGHPVARRSAAVRAGCASICAASALAADGLQHSHCSVRWFLICLRSLDYLITTIWFKVILWWLLEQAHLSSMAALSCVDLVIILLVANSILNRKVRHNCLIQLYLTGSFAISTTSNSLRTI